MSYPITDIDGVDGDVAAVLKSVGIRSTDRLLEAARDQLRARTLRGAGRRAEMARVEKLAPRDAVIDRSRCRRDRRCRRSPGSATRPTPCAPQPPRTRVRSDRRRRSHTMVSLHNDGE